MNFLKICLFIFIYFFVVGVGGLLYAVCEQVGKLFKHSNVEASPAIALSAAFVMF